MEHKIGICGVGVVGTALKNVFDEMKIQTYCYDKFKPQLGTFSSLLKTDIIFLCLPTLYSQETKEYDKSAIHEVCQSLADNNFPGTVVVKSTVEIGTCRSLYTKYKLNILHNPEFLSARTATIDFKNQNHIVIGGQNNDDKHLNLLAEFYQKHWETTQQSHCIWEEAEMMKISVNSFYAVKIQFFNELYHLSRKFDNINYDSVVDMMVANGWIANQHIRVPGTDGKLSYGGMCFPKDTNALLQQMISMNVPHEVLEATIKERNKFRDD